MIRPDRFPPKDPLSNLLVTTSRDISRCGLRTCIHNVHRLLVFRFTVFVLVLSLNG